MDIWNIVTISVFCSGLLIIVCQCFCRKYWLANCSSNDSAATSRETVDNNSPATEIFTISPTSVSDEPPPEYKWEELPPPSYEEAVRINPPPPLELHVITDVIAADQVDVMIITSQV